MFQLDFQDRLLEHGVPVPRVVPSQSGERCVETGPGSLWVLSGFVDGHHYHYGSRGHLRSTADCLSRIHAAGAGFAARPVRDETIPDLRRWWTHGEEEIADLRRMFAGAGLTGSERIALPGFLAAVQARTAARYRVRERSGADPRQALRAHVRRMRALMTAIGG